MAIGVGLVLAIFITRQKNTATLNLVPPEEDFDKDQGDVAPLTLADLYTLADRLCRDNELTVTQRVNESPDEVYWVAESKNEFFYGNYVLGFRAVGDDHPYATMRDILEFKDFTKSQGSNKGFYFTTGYFTRDVHQPLEGAKVALYNRKKVLEELKRLPEGRS